MCCVLGLLTSYLFILFGKSFHPTVFLLDDTVSVRDEYSYWTMQVQHYDATPIGRCEFSITMPLLLDNTSPSERLGSY